MRDISSPLDGFSSPFGPQRGFNPAYLFAASEPGQLSEVTPAYLFQDTAGTTPVTATGQSVALWLDQSKGLVLGPELVTNGDNEAAVSTAPLDTLTNFTAKVRSADFAQAGTYSAKLTANSTSGSHYWNLTNVAAGVTVKISGWVYVPTDSTAGQSIKLIDIVDGSFVPVIAAAFDQWVYFSAIRPAKATPWALALGQDTAANWAGGSIYIDGLSIQTLAGNHDTQPTVGSRPIYGKHPANGYRNMLAASDTLSTQSVTVTAVAHTLAFTGTGTVTLSGASTSGPLVGTGASNRVSLTFTPAAGTLTLTVSGSVTLAQLQQGLIDTTYQRTGASSGVARPAPPSYDITEAGQPDLHYLHYNGVSSFMVSPTITPGIDKAQVFVGVRKLSDAARGTVVELGVGGQTGSLFLAAPRTGAVADYGYNSGGSILRDAISGAVYPAPTSNVVTGIGDIGVDNVALRVNGTQIAQSASDQGTENYLAYPIYTGRRAGTSLPFNGLVYSKIVRFGANLTDDQIASTERWTAQRTGVAI